MNNERMAITSTTAGLTVLCDLEDTSRQPSPVLHYTLTQEELKQIAVLTEKKRPLVLEKQKNKHLWFSW